MGSSPVLWEKPWLPGCRRATSAGTQFWRLSSFGASRTTPQLGMGGTGGQGFFHRNAVLDWELLGGSGKAEGAVKPLSLAFPIPAVGWNRVGSAAVSGILGTGGRCEQTASAPGIQSPADVGPKGIVASQL